MAFGVVLADKPPPSYGAPPPPPVKSPQYNYEYSVQDDKTPPNYGPLKFGHNEKRKDYQTHGSYFVLLPDGRTQTVTYRVADKHSGFIADVTYSGKRRCKVQMFKNIFKKGSTLPFRHTHIWSSSP